MTRKGGQYYDRYQTAGNDEWMLRIGAEAAPTILFVPPLLEELNRTRAFLVSIMRGLAAYGLCCWLPDLPGTGESLRHLETCSWNDWRRAVADAAAQTSANMIVSLRGGCLIDDAVVAACHARIAPAEGASLARDLDRSASIGGGDQAGYPLSSDLLASIRSAEPAPVLPLRILRLQSDPREADRKIAGPSLWRRSEPSTAPELASAMISDLKQWADTCGVF